MTLATDDHQDDLITVEALAAAIHRLDVRKQNPTKLDDVIDLIEYLREQALEMHNQNVLASKQLDERISAITKREAELAIKQRAVESILKAQPPKKLRLLWR